MGIALRQHGSRTLPWYVVVSGIFDNSLTLLRCFDHNFQRDNVLFGQPWDEDKYWKVIEDASLLADLDMLPAADLTEVRIYIYLPTHKVNIGTIADRRKRYKSQRRPETTSMSVPHVRCIAIPKPEI